MANYGNMVNYGNRKFKMALSTFSFTRRIAVIEFFLKNESERVV